MKIRVVSALLALATMVSPALAADPLAIAETADVSDWSGPYIGVIARYGTGTADWNNGFGDIPLVGPLVGIDAGVNMQNGNFVFGIEGDVSWSGVAGSVPCTNPAFTCTTTVDWLSTLRGRAGFAVQKALLYATAGVAIGNVTSDTPPFTPGQTFSNVHVGWAAGAGIEIGVTDSLSLKAEYLYVDLGSKTETVAILGGGLTTVGVTMHTFKGGLNWHF